MTIKIEGMMCTHCRARVEKILKGIPGIETVEVSLENKCATVSGSAAPEACKKAITEAGYTVVE